MAIPYKSLIVAFVTMQSIACHLAWTSRVVADDSRSPRTVDRPDMYMQGLVFSPDHQKVAIAEDNNELRLVEFSSGAMLARLKGHTDRISAMAFSPDGRLIATGGLDLTLRVWDVSTRRELGRIDVPRCISLAFAPDGRKLASGHFDPRFCGLMFWDVGDGRQLKPTGKIDSPTVHGGLQLPLLLRYSPDGRWAVFGRAGINLLDVSRGTLKSLGNRRTALSSIAAYLFLEHPRALLSANYHGELFGWDLVSGKELFHLAENDQVGETVGSRVTSMARKPGTDVIFTSSEWNEFSVCDLKTRRIPHPCVAVKLPGHRTTVHLSALIFSDDASGLAVLNEERVYLFDVDRLLP